MKILVFLTSNNNYVINQDLFMDVHSHSYNKAVKLLKRERETMGTFMIDRKEKIVGTI